MPNLLNVAKRAAKDFAEDKVMTFAAALAFYTALSLPPLLVLLLWVLGAIGPGAEDFLRREAESLIGAEGASLVDSVLRNADERISLGGLSGILSAIALVFAASGVFVQLQAALNRIWEVEARPGSGVWGWLRNRLMSVGLLGVLAFLMLVSLAASTFIGALGLGDSGGVVAMITNQVLSIAVFTLLFAAVFKFLPDVDVRWRDVWGGALVTAVLFAIGKSAIGFYLSKKGLGSDYGAAGSAIVVLAWVYFSAAIVFIGAEITQAWLQERGRAIRPSEHAVPLEPMRPAEAGR